MPLTWSDLAQSSIRASRKVLANDTITAHSHMTADGEEVSRGSQGRRHSVKTGRVQSRERSWSGAREEGKAEVVEESTGRDSRADELGEAGEMSLRAERKEMTSHGKGLYRWNRFGEQS